MSLLFFAVLFAVGIIAEAFLLLGRVDKKDIFLMGVDVVLSAVGFIPSKDEWSGSEYAFVMHFSIAAVFFAVGYALTFKKRLMPIIDEQLLLIFNILFIYIYAIQGGFEQFSLMLIPIIFMTAAVFVNAFLHTPITRMWKIIFYIWFLVMTVAFAVMQFSFNNLGAFLNGGADIYFLPVGTLLSGMASLYIAIHLFYLYRLVPIPSGDERWSEIIKDWKADLDLIVERYSTVEGTVTSTAIIVIILGGLLAINYFFNFLSPVFLLSAGLALASFVVRKNPVVDVSAEIAIKE